MTAVPQYREVRLNLVDVDTHIREYIGGPEILNIGETMRLMLGDFFYGEVPPTSFPFYQEVDRIIVWPSTGQTLVAQQLFNAIDSLGEIFWAVCDTITNTAMRVTPEYTHKPTDCFYKFFPETRTLVVYVPVLENFTYYTHQVPMDGRAVFAICADTLPSWLRAPVTLG